MVRNRPRSVQIPRSALLPIVGDAAIAGPVVEGALVPLLIVDTGNHPIIDEVVRVHGLLPGGDVRSNWGYVAGDPDKILLTLAFDRPVEAEAAVEFSIEHQGILVEAALTSRAVYLQPGRPGDRYKHDPDKPKILIELPRSRFHETWHDRFLSRMTDVIAREANITRRKAKPSAREMLQDLEKLTGFRLPID